MRIVVTFVLIVAGMMGASSGAENGGDQILDGIGETALIARYLLDGNLLDASRNGFHLRPEPREMRAADAFLKDPVFGTVLSLPGGDDGRYARIPGEALAGADSLSVTGWWFPRPGVTSGILFDFRSGTKHRLSARLGPAAADYGVRLVAKGREYSLEARDALVPRAEWVHLAVVLDASQRTLSLYMNGTPVGQTEGVDVTLDEVFDFENTEVNRLYLGGAPDVAGLDAALHDVRLYSIALASDDVNRVFQRATSSAEEQQMAAGQRGDIDTWKWAIAAGLDGVPHVEVETWQGHLPHLPYYLPGRYRDGSDGPPVRVIWPAPVDNAAVLEAGSYTVTGIVPGSGLRPRARITVKAPDEPLAPVRTVDGEPLNAVSGVVLADRANEKTGPQRALKPFPLSDVVLERDDRGEKTPFIRNRDKFVQGLLASSPDRFLYMFRDAFGQPQPEGVAPLGGWDSRTTRLRGHATGHYLTALAQAYAGATDEATRAALREKIAYCVETLYDLAGKSGRPAEEGGPFEADPGSVPPGPGRDGYDSNLTEKGIRTDFWNWGEGFISAYPPDQFIMLEKGATYGGGDGQVWAPYYTLDKILKGLLDCHEVTGDERALAVAQGMGLWVYRRLEPLAESTLENMWNRYIAGEYGGMNTVMARLNAATGDERFEKAARLFDNLAFFYGGARRPHGLARNVDTIRGRHANQHVPQIIGALRIYGQTGDPGYYRIAENFWNLSYHSYTYSIGGVAGARVPNNAECYTAEPDHLFAQGFSEGGQNETCATYNLLKLTRDLFMYHPDGRYMDYYEQALYNQILASVAKGDPGNTYHIPLNPGARKHFGNAGMTGFTCCNGTALDSNTKLHDSIYFRARDNSALYVNLYIPSTLNWRERDVTVRQSTRYPYGETSRLEIEGAGRFALHLRIPGWVNQDVPVTINGQEQALQPQPGSYLALDRDWADGDTVELRMPFGFRLNRVMDRPDLASLFYGPVLLAAEESSALTDWRRVALDAKDIGTSIEGDPDTLRFRVHGLDLKPFFEFGTERHSVYLKVDPK